MSVNIGMIRDWPGQFAVAWRFLTVIPAGRDQNLTSERLGRSMAMFPAVGLVLGAVLVLLHSLLEPAFPQLLADLVLITALILMTGAFHMDGFADVIDGLAGGHERETILEVMRDSRIGAFGVTGLILLILFKFVSLNQSAVELKPALLFCMPAVGRWTMLQVASFSTYARKGEGTGKAFADFSGWREYVIGLVFVGAAVLLTLGLRGVLILGLAGLTTYLITLYFSTKLGGVTGDVQGFTGELNEALFLFLGVAFL
jgi:adenosylcobinamide-GDP ribazoletransferase